MTYDFETLVDRSDCGSVKYLRNMPENNEMGLPALFGAETDYKTAPCVIEGIAKKALSGTWGYTIPDDPYFEAVVWWEKHARNFEVEKEWIVPTRGTIYSMVTIMRAFTKEGDGVIIQPPVYQGYQEVIETQNRVVLRNNMICENGEYRFDFEGLEELMKRPDAKLLILCNPQNPLARVHGEEELARIAELAEKYDVLLISDEVFGTVTEEKFCAVPTAKLPKARNRCFSSISLGKDFCIQGGSHANYLIPNPELREKFIAQQKKDFATGVEGFLYTALRSAYTPAGLDWIEAQGRFVAENARYVVKFLKQNLPMVRVAPHQGGYMLWIDWSGLCPTAEVLKEFQEKARLVMDGGAQYDERCPLCTRMIIATPRKVLEQAMERVTAAVKELKLL